MADDRDPPDLAPDGGALTAAAAVDRIAGSIHLIRGERVMLDEDLATLYGVGTRSLVQAVSRNVERFPPDFAFRLTRKEWELLRSQTGISNASGRGGRRYPVGGSRC